MIAMTVMMMMAMAMAMVMMTMLLALHSVRQAQGKRGTRVQVQPARAIHVGQKLHRVQRVGIQQPLVSVSAVGRRLQQSSKTARMPRAGTQSAWRIIAYFFSELTVNQMSNVRSDI